MDEVFLARIAEQFGRIIESQIKAEAMKAANAQYPQDQPYSENDFKMLANDVNAAYVRLQVLQG